MTGVILIAALLAGTDDGAWLRFQPASTSLCAKLPGGRVRLQPYGVGVKYVLYEGFDVAASGARDFSCQGQNPLLLGPRGDLSYVSTEPKRTYREVIHVEPDAIGIAQLGHVPCVLTTRGGIVCPREYDGRPSSAQRLADELSAKGPVEVLPGVPCARTKAGSVWCGYTQSPGLTELFTGVVQASLTAQSNGCAVKRDGSVVCAGDNRYRQAPSKVVGLPPVIEVSAAVSHTCARTSAGDVWCWGRADEHQLGEAGYDDADKLPVCKLDEEAMAQRKRELDDLRAQCAKSRPRPDDRQDDPCGRMLWNLDRSGAAVEPIYQRDGVCEVAASPVRYHPAPVKVDEVKDAIAIGVSGALSCALTKGLTLVCWGLSEDEPRVRAIPSAAAAALPPRAAARPRGASISAAAGVGVCVRTPEGALRHAPFLEGGGFGVPGPAKEGTTDLLCVPTAACARTHGTIACATQDGQPLWGGLPPPDDAPGTLTAMYGFACLLRDDGVVRCGPGFGSQNQNTRVANALSAAGAITDLAGACAVYDDGALRCVDPNRMGEPPPVVLAGVANADGPFGVAGPSGCAAMRDGTVTCLGDNAYGQRGAPQTATQPTVPNVVEGLTDVEEVKSGGQHVCARTKAGEVFCWGVATKGETGKASHAKATELPWCAKDEKHKSWKYGTGCRTPGDGNTALFNPAPTKVGGVGGAIALAASAGLSCALLKSNAVACWGNGHGGVRTVTLR